MGFVLKTIQFCTNKLKFVKFTISIQFCLILFLSKFAENIENLISTLRIGRHWFRLYYFEWFLWAATFMLSLSQCNQS